MQVNLEKTGREGTLGRKSLRIQDTFSRSLWRVPEPRLASQGAHVNQEQAWLPVCAVLGHWWWEAWPWRGHCSESEHSNATVCQ